MLAKPSEVPGIAESEAVVADLLHGTVGEIGAVFIRLLAAIATLYSTNATSFTGASTNYTLGCNFPLFTFLERWSNRANRTQEASTRYCWSLPEEVPAFLALQRAYPIYSELRLRSRFFALAGCALMPLMTKSASRLTNSASRGACPTSKRQ